MELLQLFLYLHLNLVVDVGLHLLGRSYKVILVCGSLRSQVLLKHANSCERLLELRK